MAHIINNIMEILTILSPYIFSVIAAITVPIIVHVIKIRQNKKDMKDDAKKLCNDIYGVLADYNPDNNEEEYDVELNLRLYFKDKRIEIGKLADKLTKKHSSYFYKTDKNLQNMGKLLIWITSEFYDYEISEEDRIRMWSSQRDDFLSKYKQTFDKKNILNINN